MDGSKPWDPFEEHSGAFRRPTRRVATARSDRFTGNAPAHEYHKPLYVFRYTATSVTKQPHIDASEINSAITARTIPVGGGVQPRFACTASSLPSSRCYMVNTLEKLYDEFSMVSFKQVGIQI